MQDFGEAFRLAFSLVLRADADLLEIIGLSLRVSLTAVALSCLIGLPLGAANDVIYRDLLGYPPERIRAMRERGTI